MSHIIVNKGLIHKNVYLAFKQLEYLLIRNFLIGLRGKGVQYNLGDHNFCEVIPEVKHMILKKIRKT